MPDCRVPVLGLAIMNTGTLYFYEERNEPLRFFIWTCIVLHRNYTALFGAFSLLNWVVFPLRLGRKTCLIFVPRKIRLYFSDLPPAKMYSKNSLSRWHIINIFVKFLKYPP